MKKALLLLLFTIVIMAYSVPVFAENVGWECPECGAEATGNFCSNCGAKKPEWTCLECGEIVVGNFCNNCGTKNPEFLDIEIALHWEHYFNGICQKYNKIYRLQLPKITPHICRHTYCSNKAKSGMNPKVLQYLMGHSDISVTLNSYTHLGLRDARDEMKRLAKETLGDTSGARKIGRKWA